jgi:oligosaccharyltransferase complex subunit beta
MLPSLGTIFFSLFSLFSVVWAKSSTGNSVLVVLQPDLKRDNFSTFFDNLESKSKFCSLREIIVLNVFAERGYELTFRAPKSDTPPIIEDDIPTFNHIILFAPDTKCKISTPLISSLLTLGSFFSGHHAAVPHRRPQCWH